MTLKQTPIISPYYSKLDTNKEFYTLGCSGTPSVDGQNLKSKRGYFDVTRKINRLAWSFLATSPLRGLRINQCFFIFF